MRGITLIAIFSVALLAVLAIPSESRSLSQRRVGIARNKEVAQRLRIVDALNVAEAQEIAARDWMSDIIRLILGVEVGELLSSINQSLVSLNKLIADAVTRLTEIKNALDPVTQGQIEKLIQAALKEAVDIIKPIMADLGLVLPAISGRASSKDAADLIQAILGISLEQLLNNIALALEKSDGLLTTTMASLNTIAQSVVDSGLADDLHEASSQYLTHGRSVISPVLDSLYRVLPARGTPKAKGLVSDIMTGVLKFDVNEGANLFRTTWNSDFKTILVNALGQLEHIVPQRNLRDDIKVVVRNGVLSVGETIYPLVHVLLQFATETGEDFQFDQDLPTDIIDSLLGVSLADFLHYVDFSVNRTQEIVESSRSEIMTLASSAGQWTSAEVARWTSKTIDELKTAIQPFLDIVEPILPHPTSSERKWVSSGEFLEGREQGVFCNFSLKNGHNKDLIIDLISKIFGFNVSDAAETLISSLDTVETSLLMQIAKLRYSLELANADPRFIKKVTGIVEEAIDKINISIQPGLDVFLLFAPNHARHNKDVIADVITTFASVSLRNFIVYIYYTVNELENIILDSRKAVSIAINAGMPEVSIPVETLVTETVTECTNIMKPFLDIIRPILTNR